ncbi:hypothetical protein EF847_04875 [Actinobacteria bacterium YIM 96077]|uniref:Uncharacterized protein n=1 Tax=Phytoactinopolyspora halophila TaxID=1981511 RepID=A0A329R3S3_9ACTN|nr:hypothetical protein [Phytoactinopolyspora halophila]AYY12139.1 hypothetical protein EF847_04875 [Actinobacteria bacterium YIM 96077]RAW18626.1 hypothetical protein DPM12_00640 [Phytoactinopolyspora halophila]
MSRRTSGGTLAAFLILAAIIGFAGGAYLGTQSGEGGANAAPGTSAETGSQDGTGNDGSDTGDGNDDGTDEDVENEGAEDGDAENEDEEQDSEISLNFEKTSISPDEEVAYEGRIESGEEGVRLQLQRSVDGGEWEDFPVDPRSTGPDGGFSGTALSSREGENRFRMVGVDDESLVSEVVTVTIG